MTRAPCFCQPVWTANNNDVGGRLCHQCRCVRQPRKIEGLASFLVLLPAGLLIASIFLSFQLLLHFRVPVLPYMPGRLAFPPAAAVVVVFVVCMLLSLPARTSALRTATAFVTASSSSSSSAGALSRQQASRRRFLSTSTPMPAVADLRKEYSASGLEEDDVSSEPLTLFRRWLDEAVAAQVIEPNAMCLSTVSPDGKPSGRYVLLKGLDERGFVWYTNYQSRKGQELAAAAFHAPADGAAADGMCVLCR